MDKIFKIGLLVLGFGYLAYLFCPITNQAGRYRYHQNQALLSIMDTATADVYVLDVGGKRWDKLNPITGKDLN
jgi:hypothetical protein